MQNAKCIMRNDSEFSDWGSKAEGIRFHLGSYKWENRLCTSDILINAVISSMSCFKQQLNCHCYLTFTSKKQVSKGLLLGDQETRRPEARLTQFGEQ